MSDETVTKISARTFRRTAVVALIIAASLLAIGIGLRTLGARAIASQTDAGVPVVALAKLSTGDAARTVILPGTVQPYQRAEIYARVSGYLRAWNQDIGAAVRPGQLLATVDTPELDQELAQAKADLSTASANEQLAALTAARWHALLASQSVAQQDADEKAADATAKQALVEASKANVRRLEALTSFKRVLAPFGGVVTARKTDVGALINAGSTGQELFEVADLHRVRIYVQAPQALSAEIHPGLKATFDLPQYPGQRLDAVVVTSSNAVEPGSRSVLIELQADNPGGKLPAGAYCQVAFQLKGSPGAVRLPATALVAANHGTEVALLGPDGRALLKPVQIGRDLGDAVEVVFGLSLSDQVIDNPPETLQAGQAVQVAGSARAKAG